MKMQPEEFWHMLPCNFFTALKGFFEMREYNDRNNWIRTRWQTTFLLNIQMSKGKSIKPHDLIKFDWEQEASLQEIKHSTYDEYFAEFESIRKENNLETK
mgnify:FL=1